MTFLDIAKARQATRKYTEEKIDKETLDKILNAAYVAPTAANKQPVRLLVLQDEGLEKLKESTDVYNAPLAIIVCANNDNAWTRPFDGKKTTDIDASILTDHMQLQATELGLGTVWICYFKPDVIKEQFHLPEGYEAINILAIGHPIQAPKDNETHLAKRLPLNELVSYEKF